MTRDRNLADMGEAKNRRDTLGLTRKLLITRRDLYHFLEVVLAPLPDGRPNRAGERVQRRAFLEALDQLGLMKVWERMQLVEPDKGLSLSDLSDVPENEVREMTVESLRIVQKHLGENITVRAALNLQDFDEMVEAAIDGKYELPVKFRNEPEAAAE